jgi:hypothetical protein
MFSGGQSENARPATQRAHLSSDMVKRMLDENQQLLLAAMENQEKGKQKECITYLRKLHENLVMLGTVGDAQVNSNSLPSQIDVSAIAISSSRRSGKQEETVLGDLRQGGAPAESTRGKRARPAASDDPNSAVWAKDELDRLYRSVAENGEAKLSKHESIVGTKTAKECEARLEEDRRGHAKSKEAEVTTARQLLRGSTADS